MSEKNLTNKERARAWVLEQLHQPADPDVELLGPVEEERRVRAYLDDAPVQNLPK